MVVPTSQVTNFFKVLHMKIEIILDEGSKRLSIIEIKYHSQRISETGSSKVYIIIMSKNWKIGKLKQVLY